MTTTYQVWANDGEGRCTVVAAFAYLNCASQYAQRCARELDRPHIIRSTETAWVSVWKPEHRHTFDPASLRVMGAAE